MGLVSVANDTQAAVVSTEHSLAQETGVGIYVLVVDTSAMQAGDTVVLKIKTKTFTDEPSNIAYELSYSDVQAEPNKYSVPVPIDTEIVCTLTQTAGSARSYPWTLLRA